MMPFEIQTVFAEVAALLMLVAAVGAVALAFRQPLVVAFIVAGILAGPTGLGLARSTESIGLLADLGIAVLLFLVGLKLDVHLVRTLGSVAVATGLGQVLFTSVIGWLLCLALGLSPIASSYVAVALTFSSTIIIVKLLSDKRELDSLHGRIALGFLIVQDLFVVFAMLVLSTLGIHDAATGTAGEGAVVVAVRGVLLAVMVTLFGRYGAEPVFRRLSRSPELVVTAALAWAVLLSATSDWIGFGKELGGLAAGISLASTSTRDALASRLAGLRDFLLLFFFVALGTRLDLSGLGAVAPAAMVLSLFVLIGNPLIVMAIMGAMGYRRRTGFLAGLTVAQISEFSLVFLAMGARLGHVGAEAVGLVTLVGLVTITMSTYMISFSHPLYARLEPLLGVFERRIPHREQAGAASVKQPTDVVVLGLGRLGRRVAEQLQAGGLSVLGVDFDPEVVAAWQRAGHQGIYGDASDPEMLAELPHGAACMAITIPPLSTGVVGFDPRVAIVQSLREARFAGTIAVTCHEEQDGRRMQESGANVVLSPFSDAAARAVEVILAQVDESRGNGEIAAELSYASGDRPRSTQTR